MRIISNLGAFLLLIFVFQSCIEADGQFSKIAPGIWRATLRVDADLDLTAKKIPESLAEVQAIKLEDVISGELPFTFEVHYDENEDLYIDIFNGEEKIRVNDVIFGRDKATAKDTIQIDFPLYESYIRAICNERAMQGEWVVKSKSNYAIPFVAKFGDAHRFTVLKKKPLMDMSGNWEVEFTDNNSSDKALGVFKQNGNHLSGTFMTETGDYRFLEGTIQANKFYLSTFDGAHAFLFEGKIMEDKTLVGTFRSGTHYKATWTAKRNEDFQLRDPNELTFLKEGFDKISFSFENTDGKIVSPEDENFKGKIKLVQIFGTWCPNCKDETNFLVKYLKENPNPDLAVIGLGFEKYKDKHKSMETLRTYKEKLNIPYDLLLAGSSKKKEAIHALPMLNHIMSYPTMIFIDKEDKVRRIHTGFAGPATNEYENFTKEFQQFIETLLGE